MDNIFINEPGLKEFNVILMQEKLLKEDRGHLRLCIRNYKHMKNLTDFVSNRRLFFISLFYNSKSDYESFKFIHILKNKISYKKLYKFKKKSKRIMSDFIHNIDQFFTNLSSQMISNGLQKLYLNTFLNSNSVFNICDKVSSTDNVLETSFVENEESQKESEINMSHVDQPLEKFFTSSFSDLSDCAQEPEDKPFDNLFSKNAIFGSFFVSDSLFLEKGDDSCRFLEFQTDKSQNSIKGNLFENDMSSKKNERNRPNRNSCILFRNESSEKVFMSNDFDIMNQNPHEDIPKLIDLNAFFSENNEEINFNFKKIKNKRMNNRILEEKDGNAQKSNDPKKEYDFILKKNTTSNSNYKFIKVYRTNASSKKVSINSTKRERKVTFVESCEGLPHNTTEVKPILQKPGKNKRVKITKTKQAVFIQRLS